MAKIQVQIIQLVLQFVCCDNMLYFFPLLCIYYHKQWPMSINVHLTPNLYKKKKVIVDMITPKIFIRAHHQCSASSQMVSCNEANLDSKLWNKQVLCLTHCIIYALHRTWNNKKQNHFDSKGMSDFVVLTLAWQNSIANH